MFYLVVKELGDCCWVFSFAVLNPLIQGVELLTSPWYLFLFAFTKSSMPYLSNLASSSNPKMRKKHGKKVVLREINCKRKMLWKRKDARRTAWKRERQQEEESDKGRAWDSDRKRWKEQEKWGDEKLVRRRCNPNYHLNFEFHPTFRWNYFSILIICSFLKKRCIFI
jgi:hypothetical protein